MKEIGGYFELELGKRKEFHSKALGLNSGRNCFDLILQNARYPHIWLPKYSCSALEEPLKKNGVDYSHYAINKNLSPELGTVGSDEVVLFINYFGLMGDVVKTFNRFKSVIIDNSQGFFEKPNRGVKTFYSPRKFFGVPDGGYLYDDDLKINTDFPQERDPHYSHLIKRVLQNAEFGFDDFRKNEVSFGFRAIEKMSPLSKRILSSINYRAVGNVRQNNFYYLHSFLKQMNELDLDTIMQKDVVPMVYPLLIKNDLLRNLLLDSRIFVGTFWPNVSSDCATNSWEWYLAKYLIPLPVDQRYGIKEMKYIINTIRKIHN